MYYKKQGDLLPVIKTGHVYEESYFSNGYLFLKYSGNNIPTEKLTEVSQQEYEANKPVVPPQPKPAAEPTDTERIMQEMTDAELRDFETQKRQEVMAQQMTDIEILLLGGGTV